MAILYDDAEEMSSDEGFTPDVTLPEYGNISHILYSIGIWYTFCHVIMGWVLAFVSFQITHSFWNCSTTTRMSNFRTIRVIFTNHKDTCTFILIV